MTVLVVAISLGLTACGLGAGRQEKGSVQVTVSRNFGQDRLHVFSEKGVSESDTVMRLLQRRVPVKTAYGGRFVNEIDGLRSSYTGTRRARNDWFFYVNGIEASSGAAEVRVYAGDRIWWDYHSWAQTMRSAAVVGSYPEPFAHGSAGKRYAVRLECGSTSRSSCRSVEHELARLGVAVGRSNIGAPQLKGAVRVVVGIWDQIKDDEAARLIAKGPAASGVFAKVVGADSGPEFHLLGPSGEVAIKASRSAGLIAATRVGDAQPTWVITATDTRGLRAAVASLGRRQLRDRFAAVTVDGRLRSLPVEGGGGQ